MARRGIVFSSKIKKMILKRIKRRIWLDVGPYGVKTTAAVGRESIMNGATCT